MINVDGKEASDGSQLAPHPRQIDDREVMIEDGTKPYLGSSEHEDTTRRLIAVGLLVLLAGSVAGALILIGIHATTVDDMTAFFDHVWTPLIALTASAIGFYFADRRRR